MAALIGLGATGLADAVSSPDLWFGPFYLLVIGCAAWSLGRWAAVALGGAALVLNMAVNGGHLYPFGTLAAIWNLAMRAIMVLITIGLLDHIRCCYMREWRLARTDPLTGALNRQAFFELAGGLAVSRDWMMLAYADLDGLKRLNDEFGHAAGDHYLQAYARHVTSIIRRQDHFARLGGDEFVIRLKVRDEAAAKIVAQRLHREMNAVAAEVDSSLYCSLGVLILPPGNRAIDREVLTADRLMYEAKQRGAGLVVATLREVRGSQFLLEHWTLDSGLGSNEILSAALTHLGERGLDTAA